MLLFTRLHETAFYQVKIHTLLLQKHFNLTLIERNRLSASATTMAGLPKHAQRGCHHLDAGVLEAPGPCNTVNTLREPGYPAVAFVHRSERGRRRTADAIFPNGCSPIPTTQHG